MLGRLKASFLVESPACRLLGSGELLGDLPHPKGPKNLKKSGTWAMDSSFVGSYSEEYVKN